MTTRGGSSWCSKLVGNCESPSIRCVSTQWRLTFFVDRNAVTLEQRLRQWFPTSRTIDVFPDMESSEVRRRYYALP